jgi:hypothetical protein
MHVYEQYQQPSQHYGGYGGYFQQNVFGVQAWQVRSSAIYDFMKYEVHHTISDLASTKF